MAVDFDTAVKRAHKRVENARLNKQQTNNQASDYTQPDLVVTNPIAPDLVAGYKGQFDWSTAGQQLYNQNYITYTPEPTLLDDVGTALKKGAGNVGQSLVGLYAQGSKATDAQTLRDATDFSGGLVKQTTVSKEQRQKEVQDFIEAESKHKKHIENLNSNLGIDAFVKRQENAYSDKTKQALNAYNQAGNTGNFFKDVQETLEVFAKNPRVAAILLGESAPQMTVEAGVAAMTGGASRVPTLLSAIGTGTALKTGSVAHERFENTGKVIDDDKLAGVVGLNAVASAVDIGSFKVPNTMDNIIYNTILKDNIKNKVVKDGVTNKVKNLGKDALLEGTAEVIENSASNYGQNKELFDGAGKAFASGGALSATANIGVASLGVTGDTAKLGASKTLKGLSKIQEHNKTSQDDPTHHKYNPTRKFFEAQTQLLSDDVKQQSQGVTNYTEVMNSASKRLAHLDELINNAQTEKQKYKANKQKEEYLNNILPELLQRDQLLTGLIKDKYKQDDDLHNNITNSLQWLATQKQELTERLKQFGTKTENEQSNTNSNSKVDNNSLFVGDSIARGYKQSNLATNGHNPKKVLGTLQKAAQNNGLKGKTVVLSTGLSNNPDDWKSIDAQLELLSNSGANVVVLSIASNFRDNTNLSSQINNKLKQKAEAYGFGFQQLGNYRDGEAEKKYKAHPVNIKLSDMVAAGNKNNTGTVTANNTNTGNSNTGNPIEPDKRNYNGYKGSKVEGKPTHVAVYDAFRNAGLSHNQALAMTAEVGREGDFHLNNVFGFHTDAAKNKAGGSIRNVGFLSWNQGRDTKLINHLKSKGLWTDKGMLQNQATLNAMAEFAVSEMKGAYHSKLNYFWNNPNADPESFAHELGKNYVVWAHGQSTIRGQGGSRVAFDWQSHDTRRRNHLNSVAKYVGDGSYFSAGSSGVFNSMDSDSDFIEWGESYLSKLTKQKEQARSVEEQDRLQEEIDSLTSLVNEFKETSVQKSELEDQRDGLTIARLVADDEITAEQVEADESLPETVKEFVLSTKRAKAELFNSIPESVRQKFEANYEQEVDPNTPSKNSVDDVTVKDIQSTNALKHVIKLPTNTANEEVEERIKFTPPSSSSVLDETTTTTSEVKPTEGKVQFSTINIRDVEALQQQGIFTPEQADSLRKLNDFNTQLANSSDMGAVRSHVLYGFTGDSQSNSTKGLSQYNNDMLAAMSNNDIRSLHTSMSQLDKWTTNQVAKAEAINTYIGESSESEPIYIVANKNNEWKVAENKEVYDKASKGSRLELRGERSRRLQESITQEANILSEFRNNWLGAITEFYQGNIDAFLNVPKGIRQNLIHDRIVGAQGNISINTSTNTGTDTPPTTPITSATPTSVPTDTIETKTQKVVETLSVDNNLSQNIEVKPTQLGDGKIVYKIESQQVTADGESKPVKGKFYDSFDVLVSETGMDTTNAQVQELQQYYIKSVETNNKTPKISLLLTSITEEADSSKSAAISIDGKRYTIPLGSDSTSTNNSNTNKSGIAVTTGNNNINFIKSSDRHSIGENSVYVGRGQSETGGIFSLSNVTTKEHIGKDGWLGNPYNVNTQNPNKFSVPSLEEGAKRYLETLQEKAQNVDGFLEALIDLRGKKVYADQAGKTKNIGDKNIIQAIAEKIPEDKSEALDFIKQMTTNENGQVILPKPPVRVSNDIKLDAKENPDKVYLTNDAVVAGDRQFKGIDNVIPFNLLGKNKHGHDYVNDDANASYHQGRIKSTLDQVRKASDEGKEIVIDANGVGTHLKTSAPKLYKQLRDGLLDILGYDLDKHQTQVDDQTERSTVTKKSKATKSQGKALPVISSVAKPKQQIDLTEKDPIEVTEITEIEYDKESGEQVSNTYEQAVYKDPDSENLTIRDLVGLKTPLVLDDNYDQIMSALDDGDTSRETKAIKQLIEILLNHIPDVKLQVINAEETDSEKTQVNLFNAERNLITISTGFNYSLHEQLAMGMIQASNKYLTAELRAADTKPARKLKENFSELIQLLFSVYIKTYTEDEDLINRFYSVIEDPATLLEHGLGDKKLINLLNQIPDKSKPIRTSIFDSMVRAIGNFFGFNNKKNQTVYSRLLQLQAQSIKLQRKTGLNFDFNRKGMTTVYGLDSTTQDVNPFNYYQKNWFADGFTQSISRDKPLSGINNFASKLKADLNGGLDAINVSEPTAKQRKQVNHFLTFKDQFAEHIQATFQTKHENTQFKDLKGYMVNDEGLISENTITALALAAYNYINSEGGHKQNLERDFKKILNVDHDDHLTITKEIWDTYAHIGQLHNNVALTLGQEVLSVLGLQANNQISSEMASRLESSLGDWVLASLQSANIVHFHHVSSKEHHQHIKQAGGNANFEVNEYGRVNFVSFTDTKGEKYNDAFISEIKQHSEGTLSYLSKVFGGEDRQRYPILSKPTEVITRIRGAKYQMGALQQTLVKRMQEEPLHIDTTIGSIVEVLNDSDQDFLYDIIGAKVTQEQLDRSHDSKVKSIESRAAGLARELQNALSFMVGLEKDEQGNYPQFWDYIYAARNTRMHYNSNMFDMQSSKVARALGHLNSHIVTYKADQLSMDMSNLIDEKQNATALGNFFKAIAESAEGTKGFIKDYLQNNPATKDKYYEGFTVDKIEDADFLQAFTHYLKTDDNLKEAVIATKQLIENPRKLSQDQKDAILKVVKYWEGESGSFRALIEYTRYLQAVGDSKEFTSGLAIGSDGINNGSAILMMLMGLMVDPVVMARFGLIMKDFAEKYNVNDFLQTRSIRNVGDFYTGFRPIIHATVDELYEVGSMRREDYQLMTEISPSFTFEDRSLLKSLLIPFGYSAGVARLQKLAMVAGLDDVKDTMMGFYNSWLDLSHDLNSGVITEDDYRREIAKVVNEASFYSENLEQFAQVSLPKLDNGDVDITQLKSFWFKDKDHIKIDNAYHKAFNPVLRKALDKYQGDLIKARKLTTGLHSMASGTFITLQCKLEEEVTAEIKEDIRKHVKSDLTYIKNSLNKKYQKEKEQAIKDKKKWEGWSEDRKTKELNKAIDAQVENIFNIVGIPKSVYKEKVLDELDKIKPVIDASMNFDGNFNKSLEGSEITLYEAIKEVTSGNNMIDAETLAVSTDSDYIKVSRSLAERTWTFQDVGVGGQSIQVQGVDATTAAKANGGGNMVSLNVHDAKITNTASAAQNAQFQNKMFHETIMNYPMNTINSTVSIQMLEALKSFIEQGKFTDNYETLMAVIESINGISLDLSKGFKQLPDDVGELTKAIMTRALVVATLADKRKLNQMQQLAYNHQYGFQGGAYKITEEDNKQAQENQKQISKQFRHLLNKINNLDLNINSITEGVEPTGPAPNSVKQTKYISSEPNAEWISNKRQFTNHYTSDDSVLIGKLSNLRAHLGTVIAHRELDSAISANVSSFIFEDSKTISKEVAAKLVKGGYLPIADYIDHTTTWTKAEPITNANPNQATKPSEHRIFSGLANGADSMWGYIAQHYGYTNQTHFRPHDNTIDPMYLDPSALNWQRAVYEDDISRARQAVNKLLGRNYENKATGNLHARNLYQVIDADRVIAMAQLENVDTNETSYPIYGGTNTAVMLGKVLGKEVFVWDLNTSAWFELNSDGVFQVITYTPALAPNTALVGTRKLDRKAKDFLGKEIRAKAVTAMKEVMEATNNGGYLIEQKKKSEAVKTGSDSNNSNNEGDGDAFFNNTPDVVEVTYAEAKQRITTILDQIYDKYPLTPYMENQAKYAHSMLSLWGGILDKGNADIRVKVLPDDKMINNPNAETGQSTAYYIAREKTIYIAESVYHPKDVNDAINLATILAHETNHAATADRMFLTAQEITRSMDSTKAARITKAYEALENLRDMALAKADTYSRQIQSSNLSEFMAYFYSDINFMNWVLKLDLPVVANKSKGTSWYKTLKNKLNAIASWFKDALGLSQKEHKQLQEINAHAMTLIEGMTYESDTFTVQHSSVNIKGDEDIVNAVNDFTPEDSFKKLNKGTISNEHDEHLDNIFEKLVKAQDKVRDVYQGKVDKSKGLLKSSALAHGFTMSEKEVHAYEALYLVSEAYEEPTKGSVPLRELQRTYESIRLTMQPEDFLADKTNYTKDELALAKKQWNFLFSSTKQNVPKQLHRFVALALTNERFKQQVNNVIPAKKKADNDGWFDKLMQYLDTLLNWLNQAYLKVRNKETDAKINILMDRLSVIENQVRNNHVGLLTRSYFLMLKPLVPANKVVSTGFDIGKLGAQKLLTTLTGNSEKLKHLEAEDSVRAMQKKGIKDPMDFFETAFPQAQGNDRYGIFMETLNEIRGYDGIRQSVEKLLRITQSLGQQRANNVKAAKDNLAALFSHVETADRHTITNTVLRTDVSSLLDHYSIDKTLSLLSNHDLLSEEILKTERFIETSVQKTTAAGLIMHTKTLGAQLIRGHSPEHLLKNARSIISYYFDDEADAPADMQGEIDKLATLYGLSYMTDREQADIARLSQANKDQFKTLLKFHKNIVKKSMEDFKNNPYSYQKGYLPEKTNPLRSLQWVEAGTDEYIQLINEGWEDVTLQDLGQDKSDQTSPRRLMFHRDAHYQNYTSGALDMKDTHAKGSIIYDHYHDQKEIMRVVKEKVTEVEHRNATVNPHTFNPFKSSSALIPAFNEDGSLINYHYEMTDRVKNTFLERDNDFIELLPTMYSELDYKPVIAKQQREVAQVLYQDYQNMYKNNPELFVILERDSTDPKVQEMWRMLPYHFRSEAASLYGKNQPIIVRRQLINMSFGYRNFSLTEIWDKNESDLNLLEKTIKLTFDILLSTFGKHLPKVKYRVRQGERINELLVKLVKDFIIMRTVDVLWNNIIANTQLLLLRGISPIAIAKGYTQAWIQGREYRNLAQELADIRAQIQLGRGNIKKLQGEANRIEHALKQHRMHRHMKAGFMSTIIEDTVIVGADSYYSSALEETIAKKWDKIPKPLRSALEILFMSPNTKMYKFMSDATQFSDFAAKVILVEHLESQGMSYDTAAAEAQNNFINYDAPQHRALEYQNRMGAMLFMKFFLRFQHVLYKQFKDRPASILLQHYAAESLGYTGILDPSIALRIGNNPFSLGGLEIFGAAKNITTVDLATDILP